MVETDSKNFGLKISDAGNYKEITKLTFLVAILAINHITKQSQFEAIERSLKNKRLIHNR